MCVIACIENQNQIPSHATMDKMYEENPHFCSIAYFDNQKKMIYFKKGMKLKELKKSMKIAKKRSNSIIQHYRIASSGSATNKLLNHGFMITHLESNKLEGYTTNDLLFHNGTMDLNELLGIVKRIMVNRKDVKFHNGELSDTLVMSWILSFVDYSFLNMYTKGNKFAIMSGKTGKITKYGDWTTVKDNENTLVTSNDYFNNRFDYFDTSAFEDNYMADYLSKQELESMDRIIKEYNVSKQDIIYMLSNGMSIEEIEDDLKNDSYILSKYQENDYNDYMRY